MVEGTGDELTLDRDDGSPSRRPRALWGALAAIAVLAGTLAVVAASGDGDGSPRALPVGLDGAAFGGAEGAATADMSMAAWITYVAGEGLPSLGGEAPAYRLVGDVVDEERVSALGDALGMDGPVRVEDGGRFFGMDSERGTLGVYGDGTGAWTYSGAVDDGTMGFSTGSTGTAGGGWAPHPGATDECTVTQAPDGSTVEECVSHASPVPEDLPSRDEAEAIALDLLSATGLDVDDARVTVEGPYDAWYVMVEPVLDGVPVSGWFSTVGVGSKGSIISGSGTLATAERVDDYPLLDTRDAIDRLNAQSAGFGGAEPMPLPAPDVEVDSGSTSAQCPDAAVDCETVTTACVVQPDGREICEHPTTTAPCAPQPDGREICEVPATAPFDRGECVEIAHGDDPDGSVSSSCVGMPCPPDPGSAEAPSCPPSICPQESTVTTVQDDGVAQAPNASAPTCSPPMDCRIVAEPGTDPATTVPPAGCDVAPPPILPEPEPLEVVLTGAERVLILAPAVDGSGGAYLVPGYRFTSDEGHTVDVMAVTDDVLAPTQAPAITEPALPPPETTELPPGPGETTCETSASGEPCDEIQSSDPDVVHLDDGEQPQIGVPYYVDVDVECGAFELGGLYWRKVDGDMSSWSRPHEGGTFTIDSAGSGTFVGDHEGSKTARFVADNAGDGCIPTPRG